MRPIFHQDDLALRELDRWDRPLPFVAPNRDSQAVQFVKPYILYRPGLSIGEDHGFADKLSLGLLKRTEDGWCTALDGHACLPPNREEIFAQKGAQVVTGKRGAGRPGRACLLAILRCPVLVVVVSKGFRASTVWTSKPREIGLPTLALKANKRERQWTSRANRMVVGHQGIKKKILGCLHGPFLSGTGMLRSKRHLINDQNPNWFGGTWSWVQGNCERMAKTR